MSGSVNTVILVGNLGADPEIKSFSNGGRIANLRVATSENWTDRASGEKRERTEWHSVVVNGDGLVGVVERFLRKGKKIYIQGSLRTRKWQDQAGADRFSTEIVLSGPGAVLTMLDSGGGKEPQEGWGGNLAAATPGNGGSGNASRGRSFDDNLDDDEIPFIRSDGMF